MRVLLLDIETAPHRAYVWGLFDQRIATNQIVEPGYTLCFAAKWLGESGITFDSVRQSKPKAMLRKAHALLDQADAVCHFNGSHFDIPTLQGEFALHGMKPPAPFKQIDLLATCRRQFRFASNKLDYVTQRFGLGKKTQHKGMPLWHACMQGDAAAWRVMERYNRQDVRLLERLHDELLPWIKNYPNRSVHSGREVCPSCGGSHYQQRGASITAGCRYPRFQCQDCGKWFRGVTALSRRTGFREAA
jgi:hypothetical protein